MTFKCMNLDLDKNLCSNIDCEDYCEKQANHCAYFCNVIDCFETQVGDDVEIFDPNLKKESDMFGIDPMKFVVNYLKGELKSKKEVTLKIGDVISLVKKEMPNAELEITGSGETLQFKLKAR